MKDLSQQELHELQQELFEADLDFDELEKIVYECYDCGWIGSDLIEQETSLFGTEEGEELEKIILCPECGCLL